MSDYGQNFGFRRSDEHLRSGNEGRFRVPKTGVFKQGDLVTIDTANPGYVKKADANANLEPGFTGILIQEEVHLLPYPANKAKDTVVNRNLCSIWTGAGLKIWLRNTAARTIVAPDLAVGDHVEWDGSKYVKSTDPGIGRVTAAAADYAEVSLAA